MDIQKERVLATFIEWAKCEKMCTDGETTLLNYNFYDPKTRTAWKSWQAAQAVPEGFVLVPKEPTEKMMINALAVIATGIGKDHIDVEIIKTWQKMIEAAEDSNQ